MACCRARKNGVNQLIRELIQSYCTAMRQFDILPAHTGATPTASVAASKSPKVAGLLSGCNIPIPQAANSQENARRVSIPISRCIFLSISGLFYYGQQLEHRRKEKITTNGNDNL